jgi:DNA-binding NtrC family response regulator
MVNKVLLVDDENNVLQAYTRVLRRRFTLDVALGGAEALALMAQSGPYAVVVSDMRMPGMDGVEFLSQVKERFPDSTRVMLLDP